MAGACFDEGRDVLEAPPQLAASSSGLKRVRCRSLCLTVIGSAVVRRGKWLGLICESKKRSWWHTFLAGCLRGFEWGLVIKDYDDPFFKCSLHLEYGAPSCGS